MDGAVTTLYFESTAGGGTNASNHGSSGQTNRALPATSSASSFIHGFTQVNAALPSMTGAGRINAASPLIGAGQVLPAFAAGTTSLQGLRQVAAALPGMTGSGAGTVPGVLRGNAALPKLAGAGGATLTGFLRTTAASTLPKLTGFARTGLQFAVQPLPGLTGAARIHQLTPITVTGLQGRLPGLRGLASIGQPGGVLHGAGQILPGLVGPGTLHGATRLPRLVGSGHITGMVAAVRQAWALNVRVNAMTQYTNLPMRAIARAFDRYYGAGMDSGFYQLTGDTDDGTAIDWEWRTGLSDLGTRGMKGVLGVYIDGVCEPGCDLVVATDRGVYVYAHKPRGTINDHEPQRVSTGRGLRTANVGLGMASATGAYIEIDSLTPEYVVTERNA